MSTSSRIILFLAIFGLSLLSFAAENQPMTVEIAPNGVDLIGDTESLEIFNNSNDKEKFILLGHDKYDLTMMNKTIITGRLQHTDSSGKVNEVKLIRIETDPVKVQQTMENSDLTFKNHAEETGEVPCNPNSNAVAYFTDTENHLSPYVTNGSCFTLQKLSKSEAEFQTILIINADGSINTAGGGLLESLTYANLSGSPGYANLFFFSDHKTDPRFYNEITHVNGLIHVQEGGACPAGVYKVTGTGRWTGSKFSKELKFIFTSSSVETSGPVPMAVKFNAGIKEKNPSPDAPAQTDDQTPPPKKLREYELTEPLNVSC